MTDGVSFLQSRAMSSPADFQIDHFRPSRRKTWIPLISELSFFDFHCSGKTFRNLRRCTSGILMVNGAELSSRISRRCREHTPRSWDRPVFCLKGRWPVWHQKQS